MRIAYPFLAAMLVAMPTAVQAQLAEPVRAMIDAAIETGAPAKVATVVQLARQTNPDHTDEIDALKSAFDEAQAELAAQQAREKEEALAQAGLLDNWSGKGELGAFRSTGNSSNTGLTGSIKMTRNGIDWSHQLRARADYQRSGGVTSREQYLAAYEPRYQIDDGFFAYGLAQYERDRFQGFYSRYALSAGVGYTVFDTDGLKLAVKAGPAYRSTQFVNGNSDSRLAALAGLDFDYAITDRIGFTQDANVTSDAGGSATLIVDGANTSLSLLSGLQFKVSDAVSTRLSYQFDYESNPPAGTDTTDTLTRFTLVYGF